MKQDNDITQPSSSQVLGRYRILRRIGKGGMGDVWLTEDPSLHRQVAIKTLPTHSQNDREFSLRFAREAQAAAALNHPHILSIHDFGEQPLPNGQSITYIVMPYISGGSLADKITAYTANSTNMPAQEAIFYLQQAAEAIDYAHSQGVVHRDIKPGNMLLRPDNWLLLADFGIARMLSSQEQMTQAAIGIGTPEYMAPEQAQGKAEVASDNYSLAVIAYQLFTGHLPFVGDTGYAITIQHIITPPPSPREYNPSLSPAFETALLQGLTKEPQQRPSSACAFIAELQRAFAGAAFEATYVKPPLPAIFAVPSTPDGRGIQPETSGNNSNVSKVRENKPTLTRRQLLIGGGAAAVLATGGVGAWAIASHVNTRPKGTTAGVTSSPTASPNDPALILLGHTKPVTSLSWSSKANTLVSAGPEGNIVLWDMQALAQQKSQTPRPVAKQEFGPNADVHVAWSPDGNSIAIGNIAGDFTNNTTSIYLYNKNLGTTVQGYEKPIIVPDTLSIDALCWTNSKYIVTVHTPIDSITKERFLLSAWDTTQPSLQLQPATVSGFTTTEVDDPERLLSASPDGSLLAIALYNGVLVGEASVFGKTVTWLQRRSNLLQISEYDTAEHIDGVAWSSNGQYIIAFWRNSVSKSIINGWHWQDQSPKPVTVHIPDDDPVLATLAVCTAPSNTLIAGGGKKGTVYIWDANRGTEPIRIFHGDKASNASIGALEWSADGTWLAVGYKDVNASILVWNTATLSQ